MVTDCIEFLTSAAYKFERYFLRNPVTRKIYENIGYTIIILLIAFRFGGEPVSSFDIQCSFDTYLNDPTAKQFNVDTNGNIQCSRIETAMYYDEHIISIFYIFCAWNLWYQICSFNVVDNETHEQILQWANINDVDWAQHCILGVCFYHENKRYVFYAVLAILIVWQMFKILFIPFLLGFSLVGHDCDSFRDSCLYIRYAGKAVCFGIICLMIMFLIGFVVVWYLGQLYIIIYLWHWNEIDLYLEHVYQDEYQCACAAHGEDTQGHRCSKSADGRRSREVCANILKSEPHLVKFIKLKNNPPHFEKYLIYILHNIILPSVNYVKQYLRNSINNSKYNVASSSQYRYNIWDRFIWYPIFDIIISCHLSSFIWQPLCAILSAIDLIVFKFIDTILDYIHQLYVPQWVPSQSGTSQTAEWRVRSNSIFAKFLLFATFSLFGLPAAALYFHSHDQSWLEYESISSVWNYILGTGNASNNDFANTIYHKCLVINALCLTNILGKQVFLAIVPIYYGGMNATIDFEHLCYFLATSIFASSNIYEQSIFDSLMGVVLNMLFTIGIFWYHTNYTDLCVNDVRAFGFSNDIGTYIAREEGNIIWYNLKYYFKKWFMIDYFKIKMIHYVLFYHSPINEYYVCDIIISYCVDLNDMHYSNGMILCNSMIITSTNDQFIVNGSFVDYKIPFAAGTTNIENALLLSNHPRGTITRTKFTTDTFSSDQIASNEEQESYIAKFILTLVHDTQLVCNSKKLTYMKEQKRLQTGVISQSVCRYTLDFP